MKKQLRQKCQQCGLTYRYDVDFQEHVRLGCKVESGKGETFSEKDADETLEPIED